MPGLRREDLFKDNGTDALIVCVSVPLPFARLALAVCAGYGWQWIGLSDGEEALIETGFGNLIEAMSKASEGCMIGQIIIFPNTTLPDGVLLCDGSTFDQAEYPTLYNILGSNALPDLRGRFVLAAGNGHNVGDVGGAETHTLTIPEMPTHSHGYTAALPSVTTVVVPDEPSAVPGAGTTAPAGGNQAHNNMPPFYTLVYGIIAK